MTWFSSKIHQSSRVAFKIIISSSSGKSTNNVLGGFPSFIKHHTVGWSLWQSFLIQFKKMLRWMPCGFMKRILSLMQQLDFFCLFFVWQILSHLLGNLCSESKCFFEPAIDVTQKQHQTVLKLTYLNKDPAGNVSLKNFLLFHNSFLIRLKLSLNFHLTYKIEISNERKRKISSV